MTSCWAVSMNNEVVNQYNEYLKLTGGDRAAAASLTLAAVMIDGRSDAAWPAGNSHDRDRGGGPSADQPQDDLRDVPRSASALLPGGPLMRIPVEEVERLENESGARGPAPRFPDIIKRYF